MCNAFYQCAHGHRFPDQYCSDNLLFNGEVCDYPENVTCPNDDFILYDDIVTKSNPTATLAITISTATTQKTTKYMTTTTTTATIMTSTATKTMKSTTTTSTSKTTTATSTTSTTNTSTTTTSTTTTTTTPTYSTDDPFQLGTTNFCSDGIHAHPTMCNAFYQCAHGHRFPDQYCPDNLLFNGKVCDYPENVKCPNVEYELNRIRGGPSRPGTDICPDGIFTLPTLSLAVALFCYICGAVTVICGLLIKSSFSKKRNTNKIFQV